MAAPLQLFTGFFGSPIFRRFAAALGALTTFVPDALATGHGPAYALATPTLPQGGWSLDVGGMYRLVGDTNDGGKHAAMLRPMVAYGIDEDLELALSAPLPVYTHAGQRSSRMMGLMPATMDAEALLSWRFHRTDTGVGSRFESSIIRPSRR